MFQKALKDGYSIRQLDTDTFGPLFDEHCPRFFNDTSQIFRFRDTLTDKEVDKAADLRSQMGDPLKLNLGLYHEDNFVGWTWGFQESAETYLYV